MEEKKGLQVLINAIKRYKTRFFAKKSRKKRVFSARKNTPKNGFFLFTSKKTGVEQSSRVGAPNIAAKKRVFGILFPVLFFGKVKIEKNREKNTVFSEIVYVHVNKSGHFLENFR